MPQLFTTSDTGNSYTGYLYTRVPGSATFTSVTLPTTVRGLNVRPYFFRHGRKTFILGQWSRTLVYTENDSVYTAGLLAPTNKPTITGASGNVTGEIIGHLAFAHKQGQVLVTESGLGPASSTFDATASGFLWGNLPAAAPDSRATHIRGYRSVDGALPRLVWERAIGTTSVTESMSTTTLSAQRAAPSKLDSAGNVVVDLGARGIPPYSLVGCMWHNRAWYVTPTDAGVWFSREGEPEGVNPDKVESFLETLDGELPVAISPLEDELVLFCQRSIYSIAGWSGTDFRIRKVSSDYGSISPYGVATIQGSLFFPSEAGIAIYSPGGSVRNLMARSYRASWSSAYAAAAARYQNGIAINDRKGGNYIFNIPLASEPKTLRYVGHYRPMLEEGAAEPIWTLDKENREQYTVGELYTTGSGSSQLAYGGADGHVRAEDATDDNDDSDTYNKAGKIAHKHLAMNPAGHLYKGGRVQNLTVFAKTENQKLTVKLFPGDDSAYEASAGTPPFSQEIPAGALSGYVSKTSHPLQVKGVSTTAMQSGGVTGKGVTIEVSWSAPVGLSYRGVHMEYEDSGVQSRRPTS